MKQHIDPLVPLLAVIQQAFAVGGIVDEMQFGRQVSLLIVFVQLKGRPGSAQIELGSTDEDGDRMLRQFPAGDAVDGRHQVGTAMRPAMPESAPG